MAARVPLPDKTLRALLICNLTAAFFHLAIAIAVAVKGDMSHTAPVFAAKTSSSVTTLTSYGTFPITAITFSWPLITSLFHFGAVLVWPKMYIEELEACRNPMRWLEYSITASLMSVVINFLTGIRSILTIVTLAVVVASTILCGWSAEQVNAPAGADAWAEASRAKRLRNSAFGFLLFTAEWGVTLVYFLDLYDCRSGPVVAIIATELPLWLSFGVVQVYQLISPPQNYVLGEYAYIALSFTAKAVLALLTLAAGYLETGTDFC